MPLKDSLLATMVAAIWGVNFTVMDLGLEGVPPALFLALRFTVVLLPAVLLVPRPAVPLRVVLLVGTFLSLGQFGLLYAAMAAGMPPGLASLVLQAQVLFTVLFAVVGLHEWPSARQAFGIALGVLGLAVVAGGRSEQTPVLGLLLTLAAASSWGIGNVASRRAGVSSGLSMTVWSSMVVPVPMLALSLLLDGPQTVVHTLTHLGLAAVLSTAYSAYLASLVGYGIWNTLLARHQAAKVAPFTLLVPPVGILTAWLVQAERPGAAELIGGALLLAGVAVTVLRRPGPPVVTASRPAPSGLAGAPAT